MIKLFFFLLLFSCANSHKENHENHKWSYEGKSSAYHWSELSKDNHACKDGGTQTPINLVFKKAKELDDDIDFEYEKSKAEIFNNGHTVEFDFKEDNYIEINDEKFHLKQMHFHTKSEHALDGMFYPGELHLVHVSKKGKLAVVGIFLTIDDEDKSPFKFFEKIPEESKKGETTKIDISKFISKSNPHFYYKGSLTTPPCTEDVNWVIFDRPIKVNQSDLSRFMNFYPHNDRNIQKINKHKVFHSKK